MPTQKAVFVAVEGVALIAVFSETDAAVAQFVHRGKGGRPVAADAISTNPTMRVQASTLSTDFASGPFSQTRLEPRSVKAVSFAGPFGSGSQSNLH